MGSDFSAEAGLYWDSQGLELLEAGLAVTVRSALESL